MADFKANFEKVFKNCNRLVYWVGSQDTAPVDIIEARGGLIEQDNSDSLHTTEEFVYLQTDSESKQADLLVTPVSTATKITLYNSNDSEFNTIEYTLPGALSGYENQIEEIAVKVPTNAMPDANPEIKDFVLQEAFASDKPNTCLQRIYVDGSLVDGALAGAVNLSTVSVSQLRDHQTIGSLFGTYYWGKSASGEAYSYCAKQLVQTENLIYTIDYQIPECLESFILAGGIPAYAFANMRSLKTVKVLKGLSTIPEHAFENCSSLNSLALGSITNPSPAQLKIPEGVEKIGDFAFYGCEKFNKLIIPSSVSYIGKNAFAGCTGLEDVEIQTTSITIDTSAFEGCSALIQVDIKENSEATTTTSLDSPTLAKFSLTPTSDCKVGARAFAGCVKLKELEFPSNLIFLGKEAFDGCEALQKLNLQASSSLNSLGTNAFKACKSLTEVYLPSQLKTVLGSNLFECPITTLTISSEALNQKEQRAIEGLQELTITGTEALDDSILEQYTNLVNLTLGEKLSGIGNKAFSGCSSLKTVEIPASVKNIGDEAFCGCEAINKITLNYGLENIGEGAFKDLTSITSIKIPNSLETLGAGAFSGCKSLKSITLPFVGGSKNATNSSSSTLFGYIFGEAEYVGGDYTEQYYTDTDFSTYYVPSDLRTVTLTGGNIFYGAFTNCMGIETVDLSEDIESIDKLAFAVCKSLVSIKIPSKVTSISEGAFAGCISLSEITLPKNITCIGDYAFSGCSLLSKFNSENENELIVPNGVETIGQYAFMNVSSIKTVVVPDSVTSIGSNAFSGCIAIEEITVPFVGANAESTDNFGYIFDIVPTSLKAINITVDTTIPSNAFKDLSNIESITIPKNTTSIGIYAFQNCGLTAISLGNQIKSIDTSAFYQCSSLEKVYITDLASWCAIEFANSFANPLCFAKKLYLNENLVEELTIPDEVKKIGNYAFYNNTSLTAVKIGKDVSSIGDEAFASCTELSSISLDISNLSDLELGSKVLNDCPKLAQILLPEDCDIDDSTDQVFYITAQSTV